MADRESAVWAWRGDAVALDVFASPDNPWAGFFSSEESVAERFALAYAAMADLDAGVVHEVEIVMRAPRIIDARGAWAADFQFGRARAAFLSAFLAPGCDGVVLLDTRDRGHVHVPARTARIRLLGVRAHSRVPEQGLAGPR